MAGTSFEMSKDTRDKLAAALDGLDAAQKGQVLAAVADLMTEVEIHTWGVYRADLRKQWADTLAIMLQFGK